MSIVVTSVGSGTVLDRVDLVEGILLFDTGAAEDMFRSKAHLGLDDAGIYALMSDWSNGYVQARNEPDPEGEPSSNGETFEEKEPPPEDRPE